MDATLTRQECDALADLLRRRGYQVTPPGASGTRSTSEARWPLSERQVDVLRMVRQHGCIKGAARALGISYQTAKRHLRNIYEGLRVEGITDAFCWACQRGLVEPGGQGRRAG